MRYLGEYVRRLWDQWALRVGLVFDAIAFIGLFVARLSNGAAALWWVYPTLFFFALLVCSGFNVFQEEREKPDTGLEIEELECKFTRAVQRLPDGLLSVNMPVRFRLHNRHPSSQARLVKAEVVWEQPRFLRPTRLLRVIPLADVGYRQTTNLNEPIPPATSSREIELLFADSWVRDQSFRWPRRSPMFLNLTILGLPDIRLHITTVDSREWTHPSDWSRVFIRRHDTEPRAQQ